LLLQQNLKNENNVLINAFWEPVRFHIQEGKNWKRIVDTTRHDIVEEPVSSLDYQLAARSVVVLKPSSKEFTS